MLQITISYPSMHSSHCHITLPCKSKPVESLVNGVPAEEKSCCHVACAGGSVLSATICCTLIGEPFEDCWTDAVVVEDAMVGAAAAVAVVVVLDDVFVLLFSDGMLDCSCC